MFLKYYSLIKALYDFTKCLHLVYHNNWYTTYKKLVITSRIRRSATYCQQWKCVLEDPLLSGTLVNTTQGRCRRGGRLSRLSDVNVLSSGGVTRGPALDYVSRCIMDRKSPYLPSCDGSRRNPGRALGPPSLATVWTCFIGFPFK